MTRHQFHKILFLVCYWVAAVIFYVVFEMAIEGYTVSVYKIGQYYYNFSRILIIAISVVLIGGSVLAAIEVIIFSRLFRKRPFGVILLLKTTIYSIGIFLLTSIAMLLSASFILDRAIYDILVLERYLVYISSLKMWIVMLYWGIAVLSALFILQVSEKLGQGVLVNYLLGKYYHPKEEDRIFMFLDLISSTSYAERLGHKRYSELIQDCYNDLTEVVLKYEAQIYQYVGDEVVFTWKKDCGIKNNNCINVFFEFENIILSREDHYKRKYGFVPEFKAGLNYGLVTIAEVGEMKKELAFHGDAINIAARIRSSCAKFNKRLLISAELLSLLMDLDNKFLIESVGVTKLKGKRNFVGVFSVDKKIEI